MKAMRMITIGIAAVAFGACNGEVKEKLKKVKVYEIQDGRKADTYKVTEKYGALTVREGEYVGESATKPWSSWWYPINEKSLFYNSDGGASTLEKYDFYAEKRLNEASEAALFEERNIYQPNEVGWAGLCHAWAIASVLHPEPTATKYLSGVKWTVADQKALLLKSYEKAEGISDIMYGERYNGDRSNDYDDIYPDQFHKLIQDHLVEKKKPFLMDYDPRSPVWTVPGYRVKFMVEKRDATTAVVSAWVTFASPHVDDHNFVGTKRVVKNYKYELKGKWSNGVLHVNDGEWLGDSKDDHPDYLISFPDTIQRGSRNQHIKTSIVDSIVK